MKKLLIIIALFSSAQLSFAQGEWERPSEQQKETKKGALIDIEKKEIDPKYLEGNVPEENGKVCWTKTYSLKGASADQVYDKMLNIMQTLTKGEEQTSNSMVAVVNKAQHQIGVRMQENLVFSNKALSLDQTIFNYNFLIDCKNAECVVRLTNISYNYEPGRPTAARYSAEEMISDKAALNKKKNGFTRGGSKKFRMKTIDRKDELFETIEKMLKD